MFESIPNAVNLTGYVNASWTLKIDLACGFGCRLLTRMAETGMQRVRPVRDQVLVFFSNAFSNNLIVCDLILLLIHLIVYYYLFIILLFIILLFIYIIVYNYILSVLLVSYDVEVLPG